MNGTRVDARQPKRQMIEIQSEDLAHLASRATQLKQDVIRLVREIEQGHFHCDDDTAWEIVLGNQPSFLAFHLKGLLEVIVDDLLNDLESTLRGAAVVTDADLRREWEKSQQERGLREANPRSTQERVKIE